MTLLSFNPRARAGRDRPLGPEAHRRQVSIHAPARGATKQMRQVPKQADVSIHAPARGATLADDAKKQDKSVSIHAPARGATRQGEQRQIDLPVSIHAPARGATFVRRAFAPAALVSIHAPARGATWPSGLPMTRPVRFQSTRPRGARLRKEDHQCRRMTVSIHAPARGATIRQFFSVRMRPCFNPRARAGRDTFSLSG